LPDGHKEELAKGSARRDYTKAGTSVMGGNDATNDSQDHDECRGGEGHADRRAERQMQSSALVANDAAAAAPAEGRLRILHLIADLTARYFGGYQAVLATHAEGSLEAEKMQIARSYDPARAIALASRLARPQSDPSRVVPLAQPMAKAS
jgi:hypothetical protein